MTAAKELGAPYDVLKQIKKTVNCLSQTLQQAELQHQDAA